MAQVVRIHQHGAPDVLRLEPFEVGNPGPGQVLLKQDAIGVNFVDTMVRAGTFEVPLPAVLGFEGAGVVEAVGSGVTTFAVGDRVGYFFSASAYATERLIEADALIHFPADITTEQGATFLAKGLTAWMGIRALHSLLPSDIVLVQGASGGVGALLTRWAKALGATVIGVAGSAGKLGKVTAGANYALHSADSQFLNKIRAVAPAGVDVVYDFVGEATFDQSVAAVRDGGKIITIGAASGQPQLDGTVLTRREIQVTGGGTPQYVNSRTVARASAELFQAIRQGLFNDIAVVRYPLAAAAKAHEAIAARSLTGSPILIP